MKSWSLLSIALLPACLLTIPEDELGDGENRCLRSTVIQEIALDLEVPSSGYRNLPGARRYSVGPTLAALLSGDGVVLLDVSSPPEVRLLTEAPLRFSGFQPLFVEVVEERAVVLGTLQPEDSLAWLVLQPPLSGAVLPRPLPGSGDFLAHLSTGAGCIYFGGFEGTYALDLSSGETPVRVEGDFQRLGMTRGGFGVATFDLVQSQGPEAGCRLSVVPGSFSGDLVASRSDRIWTLRGDRFLQFEADLQLRYEVDLDRSIADLYPSGNRIVVGADRDIFVFEDNDPALIPRPLSRIPLAGPVLAMGPVGDDEAGWVAAIVALPGFAQADRIAVEVGRLGEGCP